MINKVLIEGYITANAIMETTTTGAMICKFSIGSNWKWGEKKETHFFRCVSFGKTAEYMAKYITKGDLISIDGRLSQNSWTDKDGNKKSTIEIIIESVYLLKKKNAVASAIPIVEETKQAVEKKFSGEVDANVSDFFDDSNLPF